MSGEAYETVVIGSGLGGLTAGAKLARDGQDVLVLEQHSVPGGCATTFHRLDFEFEVSLHEIEGFDEHDVKTEIMDELGVMDAVSFEPIPEFYNYCHGDREILVPHGLDGVIDRLVEQFPHEEAGIRRFFDVLTTIRASLSQLPTSGGFSLPTLVLFPFRNRTFFRYRNATVGEFLDDLFNDEELKLVLTANLGYYHDDPYSLSLPFFAVAQGGYLTGGGYYIEGGSQELSDYLAATIESHGGTVLTERRVTDILVADGVATGVRHERSRPGTQKPTGTAVEEVAADAVIANAAVPLVADRLLPEPHGAALSERIDDWDLAPSLSTLYLGFETPPSELGHTHYSTILAPADVETLGDTVTARRGSYGRRTISFVDYSQIEAGLAPAGKSVGALSTIDYLDGWTGLSETEYREKKARVKSVLLRRLTERFPAVADAVEHVELATPKTIRRYTGNPGGTAYGFAQSPEQSMLHRQIDSPLPNLRFASAWTFPGGGFTGAIVAGYRAAAAVLEAHSEREALAP
jgi:phytoene dehydrogenase-like protein